MSINSNLYAEKVFSEHPKALWPLDDQCDYVSLITEEQRDVSTWTTSYGTLEANVDVVGEPFVNSSVTRILAGTPPEGSISQKVSCVSSNILNFNDLNKDLLTMSVGGYFYSESPYISGIEIGYQYYDTTSGNLVKKVKNFEVTTANRWLFISETFDIPQDNTTFKLLFDITYLAGSDLDSDYTFLVNGISLGQWSEESQSTSLGVTPETIPSNIYVNSEFGIEASPYGLQENSGYYLINNNSLMAKNTGVPLVYGSSNATSIYPNNNEPSLIVPGLGFLNNVGKFNTYTLECWVRVNSDAVDDKRIIGPLGSDDGIYVSGPFIKIKIGNNFGSHYIGEWARPMLVHLRVSKNSASLLINGEQVILLSYITDNLALPEEYVNDKSQDWIGVWAYEDVSPLEIDCLGIYPYTVSEIIAKRRFVYGQAVDFPENINTAYSGSSVFIDYPASDYTNNYSYPDIGRWNQGIRDNLVIENNILYNPEYSLPDIILSNKTVEEFYNECQNAQNETGDIFYYIKNGQSDETEGHFLFNNLQISSEITQCVYGVFKSTSVVSEGSSETLIRFQRDGSDDYFSIDLEGSEIAYYLYTSGEKNTLYRSVGVGIGEKFVAGIDIDKFSLYYGGAAALFFGNRESLKVYVAGNRDMDNSYHGKIYRFGFCTPRNFNKISHVFSDRGVPIDYENVFELYSNTELIEFDAGDSYFVSEVINGNAVQQSEFWDYIVDGGTPSSFAAIRAEDHTASYTLIAKEYFDEFTLDVAVQGYWEDYIPLSYFAELVTANDGDQYYDLDFLQFNLNYPAPSKFLQEEVDGTWTYEELQSEYSSPIQRTYESLDNALFTGYENYTDLKNRSSKTFKYDTSDSYVKSYISFQYISLGANSPESYFLNTELASKQNVVEPGDDWLHTKYEVVNNMVLYPPKTSNIKELALVMHLDFTVDGIKSGRVGLRSLQLASQSFNQSSPNAIGTRFGNNVYPYKKSGVYFNYKDRNPFTIYKGQSPYLYLTRFSGIELKGQYDPKVNRGLSIPINENKSDNYKVMAMQTAIRYDQDFFPYAPTQIFEIESENQLIKFFMVANQSDGKRAKIYGINGKTGRIENGISFYLNGKIVKEPVITVREWAFIGVGFSNLIDFSNQVGSIKLNGPITFNAISHYQSTNLQQVQSVSNRPWFLVRGIPLFPIEWEFWELSSSWNGVLVLSSTSYYGVDPSDIYDSYVGTDKIIIDSDSTFSLNDYQYGVYKDISWQQSTSNAV